MSDVRDDFDSEFIKVKKEFRGELEKILSSLLSADIFDPNGLYPAIHYKKSVDYKEFIHYPDSYNEPADGYSGVSLERDRGGYKGKYQKTRTENIYNYNDILTSLFAVAKKDMKKDEIVDNNNLYEYMKQCINNILDNDEIYNQNIDNLEFHENIRKSIGLAISRNDYSFAIALLSHPKLQSISLLKGVEVLVPLLGKDQDNLLHYFFVHLQQSDSFNIPNLAYKSAMEQSYNVTWDLVDLPIDVLNIINSFNKEASICGAMLLSKYIQERFQDISVAIDRSLHVSETIHGSLVLSKIENDFLQVMQALCQWKALMNKSAFATNEEYIALDKKIMYQCNSCFNKLNNKCDLFLMSSVADNDEKISDKCHLYLYQDQDNEGKIRYYYKIKENHNKQYLDTEAVNNSLANEGFDQDMKNLIKCANSGACSAVLQETLKRGHTFGYTVADTRPSKKFLQVCEGLHTYLAADGALVKSLDNFCREKKIAIIAVLNPINSMIVTDSENRKNFLKKCKNDFQIQKEYKVKDAKEKEEKVKNEHIKFYNETTVLLFKICEDTSKLKNWKGSLTGVRKASIKNESNNIISNSRELGEYLTRIMNDTKKTLSVKMTEILNILDDIYTNITKQPHLFRSQTADKMNKMRDEFYSKMKTLLRVMNYNLYYADPDRKQLKEMAVNYLNRTEKYQPTEAMPTIPEEKSATPPNTPETTPRRRPK